MVGTFERCDGDRPGPARPRKSPMCEAAHTPTIADRVLMTTALDATGGEEHDNHYQDRTF